MRAFFSDRIYLIDSHMTYLNFKEELSDVQKITRIRFWCFQWARYVR